MAGSNSSIHGNHHGEGEPPVARAELRQMADSLLKTMERMLDAHIPGGGLLGINLMNLVRKILMEDMTVLEMVVVVAGGLVIMARWRTSSWMWSWPTCSF